jgi:ABC-2 type transport system ATP-binding protein
VGTAHRNAEKCSQRVGQPKGFPPFANQVSTQVNSPESEFSMSKTTPASSSADVPMIEAQGLSKFYGGFAASRDVTFSINQGEVAAFLGPNGAGKSTTMKLLTGYLAPSEGSARVAGFDMASERIQGAQRLGYLPENGPLYADMTPRTLLNFFADLRGMSPRQFDERFQSVVHTCNLESVLGKPIGKLSKGFRQRVGMAQALLHDPDVLILDEPTAGLDPNQIREVRKMIRELGKSKTILLSTHILQEVEAMCNRVVFINEGRLVFDGTPAQLSEQHADLDERFHQLTTAG